MSPGLPRILVLTGTSDHPFRRLLDALPALREQGIAGEVRVQTAAPGPLPPGLTPLPSIDREGVAREIAAADAVITHGGSGSCLEVLAAGHLPIVVARRRPLGEIADDHQSDLANALEERGLAWIPRDPLSSGLAEGVRHVVDRPAAAGGGRRSRQGAEGHRLRAGQGRGPPFAHGSTCATRDG